MKIKELRTRLGISQRELATQLGYFPQAINRYENGQGEPNIETLIKIADFFKVSIDELVGRETNNLNLNLIDSTRRNLIIEILNAKDSTVDRLDAFYQGIKLAELERENITNKLKGNRNDN